MQLDLSKAEIMMKKLLTLILTVFALFSCAEDIVDLTGRIHRGQARIVCCYSDGTITSTPSSDRDIYFGGIVGYGGRDAFVSHSFSTVTSSSSHFSGGGRYSTFNDCCTVDKLQSDGGSNNQSYCTDITTFMKECYSEYASYWNYNNTWTWKGTINGKEVSVSCPRLAWEQ